MEEALEMDGLALVGKIRGRNPTLGKMEEWVRTNWTGGFKVKAQILLRLQRVGSASILDA